MPEVIVDREKIADAVLDKVKHFTIGFRVGGGHASREGKRRSD
jgi:hypothetical protein